MVDYLLNMVVFGVVAIAVWYMGKALFKSDKPCAIVRGNPKKQNFVTIVRKVK